MHDRPLKIALFCDTFFPMVDGVNIVIDKQARALIERGHEVTVFVPYGMNRAYIDEFPYRVVRCKSSRISRLLRLDYVLPLPDFDRKFRREILRGDFGVFHIHSPFWVSKLAIKIANKRRIPVTCTIHSQYKFDFEKILPRGMAAHQFKKVLKVFNRCDFRNTVSEGMSALYASFGVRSPLGVLPNATDYPDTPIDPAVTDGVNRDYGLNADERVLLFVGRINSLKNIYLLADALALTKTPCKLLLVGSGSEEKDFKTYLKKNNLLSRAVLTGRVDDRERLRALYARADLFVFPSVYDAYSLVQTEAASQYTPTLFVTGAMTINNAVNGEDCFVADNDAASYASCIDAALSDPDNLRCVGANAHDRLYRTWDQTVTILERHYRDMTASFQKTK